MGASVAVCESTPVPRIVQATGTVIDAVDTADDSVEAFTEARVVPLNKDIPNNSVISLVSRIALMVIIIDDLRAKSIEELL